MTTRLRNFYDGPVLPALLLLAVVGWCAFVASACTTVYVRGSPEPLDDPGAFQQAAPGLPLPYQCGAVTCDKETVRWDEPMARIIYVPARPVWGWGGGWQ